MAIENEVFRYTPVGKEQVPVEFQVPRRDLELILGALIKKFALGGTIRVSRSEIEDAPDIEVRNLFVTDEIEMRVA